MLEFTVLSWISPVCNRLLIRLASSFFPLMKYSRTCIGRMVYGRVPSQWPLSSAAHYWPRWIHLERVKWFIAGLIIGLIGYRDPLSLISVLTQTQIACFLIVSLLLVVLLTLLRCKLLLSCSLLSLFFLSSIVIGNEDLYLFSLVLKFYRLFTRLRVIDSCITNGVLFFCLFLFFTLIASGHLRVLSLFPLSLFDSLCGNKCDVATLSAACLIFSLSPIFYGCTFKSAISM